MWEAWGVTCLAQSPLEQAAPGPRAPGGAATCCGAEAPFGLTVSRGAVWHV